MPKGLAIPVVPSQGGGAKVEEDPKHLDTILRSALSEGDDDNPFQLLGIDEKIIFKNQDPATMSLARRSVEAIVNKFKSRMVLDPSYPVQFSTNDKGELLVHFKYINLVTDKVEDFSGVIGG